MAPEKFYVDSWKWFLSNLKLALIYIVLAGLLWLIFEYNHNPYFLIFAVALAAAFVVRLVLWLVTRPKLTIKDGKLQFGKAKFVFADVVDVKHTGDEYSFFLSSRRRVVLDLRNFSETDKKQIDKIFAQECINHLSSPETREKIAQSNDISQFEFSVKAKHSHFFYTLFMVMTVGMAMCLFILLMVIIGGLLDGNPGMELIDIWPIGAFLLVWVVCLIVEKKLPRNVLTFKDDNFTLTRKDKVLVSFTRADVEGIGMPQDKGYIFFRLRGEKKRTRIQIAPFGRKNRKVIRESMKRIFFLADKPDPPVNPFNF